MAEELASLVKDNLPSKNLILSVENILLNYLQDGTSPDEVLELEPMNSYHRMLVHRLADIFRFSHYSVGEEEEDRHLVLERSPETSIPDILVSDLLSQYGEMHYVLRRTEVSPGQKVGALDEKETANSEEGFSCKQLVHELYFLVKKNLPCKNLILSLEDMLLNYLRDDKSLDGVLELEPMNSYHRMLVHRLAEIFRFSHYSVGEGDHRHVVMERRTETLMPDFLVSAFLPPMTCDVLRRKVVFPGQKVEVDAVSGYSPEERKTCYFAATQRIFSADACDSKLVKERPKKDPVVPRCMITPTLGQPDIGTKHEPTSSDTKEFGPTAVRDVKIECMDERNIHSSNKTEINFLSLNNSWACTVTQVNKSGESEVEEDVKIEYMDERNIHSSNKTEIDFLTGKNPWACAAVSQVNKSGESEAKNLQEGDSCAEMKSETGDKYLKQEEHTGGAKRSFGNAFGMHERDTSLSKNPRFGLEKPACVEVQDLLGGMSYK